MRDYYKSVLKRLPALIGTRPLEKMDADEVKALLDALERVSALYAYIPEKAQQEIIERQLIADNDYLNLNARVVAKWLTQNGKHYFKEEAHTQGLTEADYTPVSDEKRQEYLKEWSEALAKIGTGENVPTESKGGSGTRMRENLGNFGAPQKFTFDDGFECYAKDQTEADIIHSQVAQ